MSSAALAYPKATEKSAEAFRTISEVATELDLPQHVLRFWESRFNQIKPVKRAGGRRFYRPDDIDLLKGIRALLYSDGFTIKGVQKVLKDRGLRHVAQLGRGGAPVIAEPVIVEKVVYIEKPAPVKKRPTHLRAVPDMSLPFFDEPIVMAATPEIVPEIVYAIEAAPDIAPMVESAPDFDRAKLEALLAELTGLKARFRRK